MIYGEQFPKIIIYGTNLQAASLFKMITLEKQGIVEGFVVDSGYKRFEEFQGCKVYELNTMIDIFSPKEYKICLSFGYKNMVYNRKEKFYLCKDLGYELYSFISNKAIVYTDLIGEGCNIYPGTILEPFVEIGDGSFIECGCIISHHTKIGAFNFIAPGVHFCGAVCTGENCFFGGASEITNGCILGNDVFVAAAAKVSWNIEDRKAIVPSKSIELENRSSFEMMEYMFK